MASYTTNIINISLLKQYKSSFTQEKNRFNNTSYKTFSSSYLKTCSDGNIKRMSNTLDSIYKKIQKGYNSIDKWWEAYNNNAEGLENSLSNCNLSGITKSSLRAFVSANLIDLPNYKNNLTSSFNYNQIVSSFNSKFSNNSVGVSSSFTPVNNVSKSVSDKKVESYVSKINNFDLIGNVGAVATSANSRINGWVDNAIEDVTGLFEETKAQVTKFGNNVKSKVDEVVGNAKQSLIDTFAFISNKVKNLWNKFVNWLIGDALPWIKTSAVVVCDVLKSVGATVATFVVSLVEGIGQFGEAIVDLFALVGTGIASIVTGLIDGGQAIYGAITGNEWSSVTKQMWEGTKGFVSKSYVSGWFDSFYNNTKAGNSLKNNSYFFDTVRGVGSGLGYVAGVVALSVVTFGAGGVAVTTATGATVAISSTAGMSIIAGLAGFGKGTQNAWADGADIGDGLVTGALTGVWEGIQFYVGAKIGQSSIWGKATTETAKASLPIGKKILDSLARITLDAVDGGVEGFVQPLINSIYKDSYIDENGNVIKFSSDIDFATKYKELFDDAGGWKNVGIQTAIGAGSSALGEAFDLGKLLRDKVPNGKTVTNVEVVEAVSENIENNIKDIYNKKLSVTKTVGGILATPLNIFSRFKNADVTDNIEISNKVLNDGIYHFTSLDNATKILDSGYVKESDYFVSYGKKKSFFFAGIPTVDDLAVNVRGLEPKRVAVKFDIDADNLVDFKYRKFADKAISYEGRYNFDKTKASIAYLGLFEENGELVYKEISKADFDNYKCDVSTSKLTTSINKCKSTMLAMARELDYFSENVSRLKNLLSNTNVKETASFVSENSDSLIRKESFTLGRSKMRNKDSFNQAELIQKSNNNFIREMDLMSCKREYDRIIANLDESDINFINGIQSGKFNLNELDPNIVSLYNKINKLESIIDGKYVPSKLELSDLIGDYDDNFKKLTSIKNIDDEDIRICMDEYNKTISNVPDNIRLTIKKARSGQAISIDPKDVDIYKKIMFLEDVIEGKRTTEFNLATYVPEKRKILTEKLISDFKTKFWGTDESLIDFVEEAFKNDIILKGNMDCLLILSRTIDLKNQNPDFKFVLGEQGTAYWDELQSKIVLSDKDLPVFYHELGHSMFDMRSGGKIPDDWDNILLRAKKQASNENKAQNLMKTLNGYYSHANQEANVLFEKEIKDGFGITLNEYKVNFAKNIDDILKKTDVDVLINELKKLGLNSDVIEEIFNQEELNVSGNDIVKIIIRDRIGDIRSNINSTRYPFVVNGSGLVNSVFEGKKYDINGNYIDRIYHHPEEYFKQGEEFTLHEIMADFFALNMTGQYDTLNVIKKTFGDEFYNTIYSIYKGILVGGTYE